MTEYLEDLPDSCPPSEALDDTLQNAFRVVFSSPPSVEDFYSQARLGNHKPKTVDDCKFASCSLFLCKKRAINVAKLPKNRVKGPKVAQLNFSEGCGRYVIGKNKHVDYWLYAGFNPTESIVEVEEVTL